MYHEKEELYHSNIFAKALECNDNNIITSRMIKKYNSFGIV